MSEKKVIMPIGLLDKCIGSKVWIIMKGDKEIIGVLRGYDDYMRKVILTQIWYLMR
jgi:U6 snRNA-associated Sm-like protein LSm5